jgi:hypothetical protein
LSHHNSRRFCFLHLLALRPNFLIILSVPSWKTLKRKKIQKRLQLNTGITLVSSARTERKARTRESFMREVTNEGRQACEGGKQT